MDTYSLHKHMHMYAHTLTHQWAGVGGVCRVVLEETREAEVRHLTHQITVDQDVAGSQVSVHVVHVRQVLHACCDAAQHANQLDHCELPIIELAEEEREWQG